MKLEKGSNLCKIPIKNVNIKCFMALNQGQDVTG